MTGKGVKISAALLLAAAYLFLNRMASLPKAPAIELTAIQSRQPFPVELALPDLQGDTVRLTDLVGKVVLVNFWATWCPPCREEMPSMSALYQDYRNKGFEILAISIDTQGAEVVAPFVAQYGLTFPVLLAPREDNGPQQLAQGIPTTYLIDRNGRIAGREMGTKNWNSPKMRRLLDVLLAEHLEAAR
jgi:thiol-disulfide isomerase/thioredoxin